MRPFNLIVSCSENRVIGRDGRLPWQIPEDARFFREQTAGQIVVLGHICFATWPEATRDGRRPVVVSSHASLARPGVQVASSLPAALALAQALPGEIYICGGERIYDEAIAHPQAALLYLTLVHANVVGDRHFPEWRDRFDQVVASRESGDAHWRYTFLTLERSKPPV